MNNCDIQVLLLKLCTTNFSPLSAVLMSGVCVNTVFINKMKARFQGLGMFRQDIVVERNKTIQETN